MPIGGSGKLTSTGRLILSGFLIACLQSGCSQVHVDKDKKTTTTTTTTTAAQPSASEQQSQNASLAGDWKVEFQFNNSNLTSTIHLDQQGNSFKGTGTDDQNQTAFTIENGKFDNGQISFFKRYSGGSAVQYDGKFQIINENGYQGPYMEGDYTTASKGQIINNRWQAQKLMGGPSANQAPAPPSPSDQMVQAGQQPGGPEQRGGPGAQAPEPTPGQPAQSPAPQTPPDKPADSAWPPEKAPDLSGKWEVGYEYNFKTMHSIMYLEQEGSRLTGHGTDLNTKEKFTISSGWYNYPNVTIVRKYEKVEKKGKSPGSPERLMAFKAKVTVVADKDYQGPYMTGKTQGGGMWESQLLK